MAAFTLTIPDAIAPEVTAALCAAGGFADVSEENAKQAVINWMTATVQNVQQAQAQAKIVVPVIAPITGLT
jgi:hypothetical protein